MPSDTLEARLSPATRVNVDKAAIKREANAIGQEVIINHRLVDNLHDTIGILEDALEAILSSNIEDDPEVSFDPLAEHAGSSQLYYSINDANARTRNALNRLDRIIRGIEV